MEGSMFDTVVVGKLAIILSAIESNSVSEKFSDPANIARAVGGRTAKKERRRISIFAVLPGCKSSRSERALLRNCEGDSVPRDWVRKYFSNNSVLDGR